jgi:hypothetical protein
MTLDDAPPENRELRWRKSTFSSESANCVELALVPAGLVVRDSKDPDGPRLFSSAATWREFIIDVRRGGYDTPTA